MTNLNDIYHTIDVSIVSRGFWQASSKGKKELINEELRKYLISKIDPLSRFKLKYLISKIDPLSKFKLTDKECNELSVTELVGVLSNYIPKEEHFNTLRHLVHYILQVGGGLQHYAVTWWQEEDEKYIDKPVLSFDENGILTDLYTHEKTDYVRTFAFVYDAFNNHMLDLDSEDFSLKIEADQKHE